MIEVTRLSGSTLVLNADLIERVEETPDTVITLTTGTCYLVRERVEEVVEQIIEYKEKVFHPRIRLADRPALSVVSTEGEDG